ncbi:MAG TPA: hypothetical protein VLG67_01205 [Candidatus Saccharimonadales bacterium]|nr:hypothetical protein [Candidatus Saccharimonadales bacterium]
MTGARTAFRLAIAGSNSTGQEGQRKLTLLEGYRAEAAERAAGRKDSAWVNPVPPEGRRPVRG